jgi:hypothetical protein
MLSTVKNSLQLTHRLPGIPPGTQNPHPQCSDPGRLCRQPETCPHCIGRWAEISSAGSTRKGEEPRSSIAWPKIGKGIQPAQSQIHAVVRRGLGPPHGPAGPPQRPAYAGMVPQGSCRTWVEPHCPSASRLYPSCRSGREKRSPISPTFLTAKVTSAPVRAYVLAVSIPIPDDPPVTMMRVSERSIPFTASSAVE